MRRARLARVLLLAAAAACRAEESSAPRPPPPARAEAARPRARIEVERRSFDTYRVVARGAPRTEVLRQLARAAGFEVRTAASRAARRRIELELEGAGLEAALGAILGDVPHTRHYGPGGPASPEATLRAVTVGPPVSAPAPEEPERRAGGAPSPGNGDDDERALAVSSMGPETQLAELVGSLRGDPSPEVRRHAAEALGGVEGGEDAFRAADALLAALADPDPDVVASAVRALEDVHDVLPDPRIRASVGALAAHRDPAVRAAVASFLEWTEDEP